jgi:hypothetical protein
MSTMLFVAIAVVSAVVLGAIISAVLKSTNKHDLKTHKTPVPILSTQSDIDSTTKPPDTKCSCFRGGDTYKKMENGEVETYDEGFCGQCIGGIIYGCASEECSGKCEKLLFSGPKCNECNGDERNPYCIQTAKEM